MNPKILAVSALLLVCAVSARASRMFLLDDGEFEENLRYRRDAPNRPPPQHLQDPAFRREDRHPPAPFPERPLEYNPLPPVDLDLAEAGSDAYGHHGGYKKGRVGPVYTFVKTDPYGHVKWGVRHVAGKQYAGGHH